MDFAGLQPLNKSLLNREKEETFKRNVILYNFMTESINQKNYNFRHLL